jgi:co-chaperonin GroES (HSP10)
MSEPQLDTIAKPSVTDAYVSEEERVLDPAVLDKSLVESTMDKENLSTSVCYVLKVGPLAYQDESKFNGIPWCEKGDWVLIGKYSGARFQLEDNHDVRIINDDEVIGTIADPNDIKSA